MRFFSPLSITGRARRHGLHTDASHRYERGVDPALQYKAMEGRHAPAARHLCGQAGPIIDVTDETNCQSAPPSRCAARSWIA